MEGGSHGREGRDAGVTPGMLGGDRNTVDSVPTHGCLLFREVPSESQERKVWE